MSVCIFARFFPTSGVRLHSERAFLSDLFQLKIDARMPIRIIVLFLEEFLEDKFDSFLLVRRVCADASKSARQIRWQSIARSVAREQAAEIRSMLKHR